MRVRALAPLAAAAALAGCAQGHADQQEPALRGEIPAVATPRPHFTLTDTTGAPYDFFTRTKGRVTLLFWGYTHCPDTCPATLHSISLALHRVPAPERDRVEVVFVTSDPERDTPRVIRRWLDRIDPSFVGLTGTPVQIARAETAAGVVHAVEEPHRGGGYDVDHYAGTTAYGRDDLEAVRYSATAGARDYAADLPLLVGKEASE